MPLFGALDAAVQDRAIAPAPKGQRKVVLATSIAETSLTIEGVRIVVDSGLARVPRYEPDIGLTRLETVRASRAAVDQRRGRAGRTEPGVCYRLWDEPQTASLAAYTQPEILSADLSSLVLDLAQWGVRDPATLAFLDPPPAPALKEANSLLARTRRARCRWPDHRGRQEPARAGAAAAAGAHDRGFASAGRGRGGRRNRRHPDRARPRRRQRRSRCTGSTSSAATARRAPPAPAAWRSAGRSRWRRRKGRPREDDLALHRHHAGACLSRSRRAQPRQWQLRARQWPRRRRRADLVAGARALYRGRRTDRHRGPGAHSAGGADRAGRDRSSASPIRSRTREEISFDRGAMALRARRKRTLHAITLSEAPMALSPSAETARSFRRRAWSPPGSTNCRGRNP